MLEPGVLRDRVASVTYQMHKASDGPKGVISTDLHQTFRGRAHSSKLSRRGMPRASPPGGDRRKQLVAHLAQPMVMLAGNGREAKASV